MSAGFFTTLVNTLAVGLGGTMLVVLLCIGVVCCISTLLDIATENRHVYRTVSRGLGIGLAIYGLLLPFRREWNFLGVILLFWWNGLFFSLIPQYEFQQAVGTVIINLVYWTGQASRQTLMQGVGDIAFFAVVPSIFVVVYYSVGSESLSGGASKFPLRTALSRLGHLVGSLFPPDRSA